MSRRSWILFLIPVLIWSTTFYVITLQLGSVTTPTYAVGLRFACAAALLFSCLAIRKEPLALAALVSSIGAVCSMRLNAQGIPVVTYTARAMAYGAAATFIYGALSAQSFHLDLRPSFWAAFAYLTVAGTIATFLSYLTLLKREGSARTMYISVLAPIGAVIVSILWEGLRPQALTWVGIVVALAGAWVTLKSKKA